MSKREYPSLIIGFPSAILPPG
jgi:hypothetical protein